MFSDSVFVPIVWVGSCGALFLSVHSFLNAFLVRRPNRALLSPLESRGPNQVLGTLGSHENRGAETVTVCIPARNEAANIEACVKAVLGSTGVAGLEVLVLDDDSTDATASIVAALAASDARLRVLKAVDGKGSLPEGWLGKTWACERLLGYVTTPVVVFVDADVRLGSHALAAGLDMLRAHNLSLVSPYPRQLVGSWAERVAQPLLQWLWMTFLPLRLAERTKPASLTAANGQFMILDTEVLRSVGGFQTVAGEVLDDVALARSLKRSGHRATVGEGSNLATCRMYEGWGPLRDGYTKNLWSATGSPLGAAGMIAMFVLLYLVPVFGVIGGMVSRNGSFVLAGVFGYLAAVAGRLVTARATGGSNRDALLHPFSIALLVWLIVRSWRQHRRGAITWKGRSL